MLIVFRRHPDILFQLMCHEPFGGIAFKNHDSFIWFVSSHFYLKIKHVDFLNKSKLINVVDQKLRKVFFNIVNKCCMI